MEQKGYPRQKQDAGWEDIFAKDIHSWGCITKGPESCSCEVLFLIHQGRAVVSRDSQNTPSPGPVLWGVNFRQVYCP